MQFFLFVSEGSSALRLSVPPRQKRASCAPLTNFAAWLTSAGVYPHNHRGPRPAFRNCVSLDAPSSNFNVSLYQTADRQLHVSPGPVCFPGEDTFSIKEFNDSAERYVHSFVQRAPPGAVRSEGDVTLQLLILYIQQ